MWGHIRKTNMHNKALLPIHFDTIPGLVLAYLYSTLMTVLRLCFITLDCVVPYMLIWGWWRQLDAKYLRCFSLIRIKERGFHCVNGLGVHYNIPTLRTLALKPPRCDNIQFQCPLGNWVIGGWKWPSFTIVFLCFVALSQFSKPNNWYGLAT